MREFGYIVNIGLLRGDFMNFDSYIVSETKTAFSFPLMRVVFKQDKKRKKGFTLAETLITLSIIGVIAAVTVPTLMSNTNKAQYVTGLKKAYNQLQNAVRMLPLTDPACYPDVADCLNTSSDRSGEAFDAETSSINTFAQVFKHYKISNLTKDCGYTLTQTNMACLIANDGIIYSSYDNTSFIDINVDVNGIKGPNKVGRDIFSFKIIDNQIHPAGSIEYWSYFGVNEDLTKKCTTQYVESMDKQQYYRYDSYCTAKVLKENAMNY